MNRCKQQVGTSGLKFMRMRQCHNTAVKEGYCQVHHPDAVARRNERKRLLFESKHQNAMRVFHDLARANALIKKLQRKIVKLEIKLRRER